MLQIVPAIILLLLQGQAGADRLNLSNNMPATLAALTSELEAANKGDIDGSMASILALSTGDPHLSAAIIGFLRSIQSAPTDLELPSTDLSSLSEENNLNAFSEPENRLNQQVLETASRFRDGPTSR